MAATIAEMEQQMSREQGTSNEVHDVLVARWAGFHTLAKKLRNHHILAVELIRTLNDETIAVFTANRNGEPVRYVVTGDSHGRVKSIECHPHIAEANRMAAAMVSAVPEGGVDPAVVSLSEPPPREPPTPGIVAIADGLLGAAFDIGDLVNTDKS